MQDVFDKESLKKLYVELIQTLIERRKNYSENKLAIFSAIAGSAYKKGGIMVVGRAVNGWKYNLDLGDEHSGKAFVDGVDRFLKSEELDWVGKQWGVSKLEKHDDYNTKKSAFWRLIREIVANNGIATDDFANSIVWSNLYKAAKYKGDSEKGDQVKRGNLSARLRKVEVDLCRKIFDTEIDLYQPKFIVFLTGFWWAQPFLNIGDQAGNVQADYVQHVGVYRNANYLIGPHPQGKKGMPYLLEICKYLFEKFL